MCQNKYISLQHIHCSNNNKESIPGSCSILTTLIVSNQYLNN